MNDLVYILDGSWSVCYTDFDTAQDWLVYITSGFDISSHYSQVRQRGGSARGGRERGGRQREEIEGEKE